MNALTTARWGLTSAEHYYGLPEALYEDRVVQNFPLDYNYTDEYFRFSVSGQMFSQAAKPGTRKWEETLEAFLEIGFTFVPTFTIYDANRDLMRARQAYWHKDYTWKSMWDYFTPQRGGHGSYWYRWSTQNEIEWKENYRLWMAFINEYKNRGGRVCTGSDSGFIYQIFGFGYIRELELLQEAGFHPLEVIRSATSQGAALCGLQDEIGTIDIGMRADMLVHDHNPLTDFKLLYGTGAMRFNDATNAVEWHRGLKYTIKDGIIYDTEELLADVRELVKASWESDVPGQIRRKGCRRAMSEAGLDFFVLTGFLGSGKTTLLRDFLGSAEVRRHGRHRQRGRRDRARRRRAARERRRPADGDAVERLRLLPDRQRSRLHDRPADHGAAPARRRDRCAGSFWRPAGSRCPGRCCERSPRSPSIA